MTTTLANLKTPCLLLDQDKMRANQDRMNEIMEKRSVSLRPHLKTLKSVEAARYLFKDVKQPITVSTLKEAREFGRTGFKDILYAVAMTPQKLDEVIALRRDGIDLKILIDSEGMADVISQKSLAEAMPIPTFIEIDVDGHRAGFSFADGDRLVDVARRLNRHAQLHGIMAHAGESYHLDSAEDLREAALDEANKTLHMAKKLYDAGIDCPHISIGSTPTAHADIKVGGITEVRAGVYLFFDLVQAGIGVCSKTDIALSVLTTVNGYHERRGQIFIDAGWMALSGDQGTGGQKINQYYGVVCDEYGNIWPDLVVRNVNQEHGMIIVRPGVEKKLPYLPIGTRLRILPNHACATAAQHEGYHVLNSDNAVVNYWPRIKGW
ncbi:alanine racemase [Paremcibacter congregatus]|uniref:alanine racemase n=1 Tax=Paremcibacter congregatus TaxID=2043170 RepID=UPI003A8D98BD